MSSIARQLVASACILANGLIAGYTPSHFESAPPKVAVAAKPNAAPRSAPTPIGPACGAPTPPPDLAVGNLEALPGVVPDTALPPPAQEPQPEPKAKPKKWEKLLTGSCKLGKAQGAGKNKELCLPETDWKVGLRMPDLPIESLERLDKYIKWYSESTYGRKVVRNWLKRSGRYRGVVAKALREHDLPHDLQAVVFVESGYSPTAKSPAGAVGLWQFMRQTGKDYGLVIEHDYDERRSVERSSDAAASHLADLYGLFGNWDLAMAAYSMGAKSLAKRMQEYDTEDFWQLAEMEVLPKETIGYVPKILAFAVVLKNLERFGFDDISPDPPWFTADVEMPSGIHMGLVARAAGTSLRRIRELNPEILGDVVPGRGRDIIVHIPSSGLARAKVLLPRLLFEDGDGLETKVPPDFDWGRDELASSMLMHDGQSPTLAAPPEGEPKPAKVTPHEKLHDKPHAESKTNAADKSTKKVGALLRTRPTE